MLCAKQLKANRDLVHATFPALFAAFVASSSDWRFCDFSVKQLSEWYLVVISVSCLLQHDTTVSALLSALNVFDGIAPAYSSAVMIELFSDENDNK